MTINIRGRLLDLASPVVMGIINATPDSFYSRSRVNGIVSESDSGTLPAEVAVSMAERHIAEGAAILDIGACSTRPGSAPVCEDEELRRLDAVLPAIRRRFPDAIISIDTFRSAVVRHCADLHSIDIINDVSAGVIDPSIFQAAADLHLPYILMHGYSPASPSSPSSPFLPSSPSASIVSGGFAAGTSPSSLARFFAAHLETLYSLGVADVILDPGIGFGKSSAESMAILRALPELVRIFPDNAWLIGLSRKRIVYETLGITPDLALNGTTVLNTLALHGGAHILRVHDVRPAIEAITLTSKFSEAPSCSPPAHFYNQKSPFLQGMAGVGS